MEVKVLLYGILREKLGKEMISVELEGSPKAMDLFAVLSRRYPEISPYLSVTRLACGERLLSGKDLLPGSEVALLPPVSGGSLSSSPSILRERLDLTLLLQETFDDRAGAVVIFLGVVRGLEKGERVISIEYEGYEPLAERRLKEIEEAVERREGILRCRIQHRLGELRAGEISLAIVARGVHRGETFEAVRYALERVKREVPVWKRERLADGTVRIPEGVPLAHEEYLFEEEKVEGYHR